MAWPITLTQANLGISSIISCLRSHVADASTFATPFAHIENLNIIITLVRWNVFQIGSNQSPPL